MGGGVVKKGGGGGRRRRGRSSGGAMSEINITPFVDVMLVLLIIFMVAAPMMTVGVPLELPKTAANSVPTEQEEPLTISLQIDGSVSMMNTPVAEDELVARLVAVSAERDSDKVYLRADGGIEYSRVVGVMGALNAGGFTNIVLVTDTGGPSLSGAAAPQAGN
ncbi:ExbD/TolR family protein [Albirhodobacter sp. R86504]|jgi:biopolymer transport protein TolR|uniref:ExbD/TolR family protein n=1 Tax=Albirhodobacter sp. R86504 TaxID=3093848 RepID=UPI00366A5B27